MLRPPNKEKAISRFALIVGEALKAVTSKFLTFLVAEQDSLHYVVGLLFM